MANKFISALLILSLVSMSLQASSSSEDLDWIEVQKTTITKIIIFVCVLGLLGLIVWKVWDVRNTITKNKILMEEFED